MIKCTNPKRLYRRCVIDVDSQKTLEGIICCDTAKKCEFRSEAILICCEYAKPGDIKDAALKELFS